MLESGFRLRVLVNWNPSIVTWFTRFHIVKLVTSKPTVVLGVRSKQSRRYDVNSDSDIKIFFRWAYCLNTFIFHDVKYSKSRNPQNRVVFPSAAHFQNGMLAGSGPYQFWSSDVFQTVPHRKPYYFQRSEDFRVVLCLHNYTTSTGVYNVSEQRQKVKAVSRILHSAKPKYLLLDSRHFFPKLS